MYIETQRGEDCACTSPPRVLKVQRAKKWAWYTRLRANNVRKPTSLRTTECERAHISHTQRSAVGWNLHYKAAKVSPLCWKEGYVPARKEIQEKKFVLNASTAAQQTQEMKWDASTPRALRGEINVRETRRRGKRPRKLPASLQIFWPGLHCCTPSALSQMYLENSKRHDFWISKFQPGHEKPSFFMKNAGRGFFQAAQLF